MSKVFLTFILWLPFFALAAPGDRQATDTRSEIQQGHDFKEFDIPVKEQTGVYPGNANLKVKKCDVKFEISSDQVRVHAHFLDAKGSASIKDDVTLSMDDGEVDPRQVEEFDFEAKKAQVKSYRDGEVVNSRQNLDTDEVRRLHIEVDPKLRKITQVEYVIDRFYGQMPARQQVNVFKVNCIPEFLQM